MLIDGRPIKILGKGGTVVKSQDICRAHALYYYARCSTLCHVNSSYHLFGASVCQCELH